MRKQEDKEETSPKGSPDPRWSRQNREEIMAAMPGPRPSFGTRTGAQKTEPADLKSIQRAT